MFELHPRLADDCFQLGRFSLCRLLLMNDSQFPWFILVPEKANITEIYQLSTKEQHQFLAESSELSTALMAHYQGDKLNVAALGNVVPQLHVHHVVRFKSDPAWPAPIWGKLAAVPYTESAIDEIKNTLRGSLSLELR